jgi:hypothetical protein
MWAGGRLAAHHKRSVDDRVDGFKSRYGALPSISVFLTGAKECGGIMLFKRQFHLIIS